MNSGAASAALPQRTPFPFPCRSGFSRELFAGDSDEIKSSRLKPLLQGVVLGRRNDA